MDLPSLESILERYQKACKLQQAVDTTAMMDAMQKWLKGITDETFTIRMATSLGDFFEADSWDEKSKAADFIEDVEIANRNILRTDAAKKAKEIWNAGSAWLAGEWPNGTWEISWWVAVLAGAIETGDWEAYQKWQPMLDAFEAGAFLFCLSSKKELIIAPIPSSLIFDENGLLHCETAPAYVLMDYQEYHWHGVTVPAKVITHPESITMEQINKELSPALKKVLLERFNQVNGIQPND